MDFVNHISKLEESLAKEKTELEQMKHVNESLHSQLALLKLVCDESARTTLLQIASTNTASAKSREISAKRLKLERNLEDNFKKEAALNMQLFEARAQSKKSAEVIDQIEQLQVRFEEVAPKSGTVEPEEDLSVQARLQAAKLRLDTLNNNCEKLRGKLKEQSSLI